MSEVDLTTWWAPLLAFAAGLISFASPCVLPLVPGYLSFVSGTQAAGSGQAGTTVKPAVVPMLLFVAGFATVFSLLGAFAGTLVPIVRSQVGQKIAGVVVLGVGALLILQSRRIGGTALYMDRRPLLSRIRPGRATAYPLGMAFATGWTPCIGPVLAGTLALATVQGGALRGSAPIRLLPGPGRSVPADRSRGRAADGGARRPQAAPRHHLPRLGHRHGCGGRTAHLGSLGAADGTRPSFGQRVRAANMSRKPAFGGPTAPEGVLASDSGFPPGTLEPKESWGR